MPVRRFAILVAALVVSAIASSASAGPIERLFTRHHGLLPACDSHWALNLIFWRFAVKERLYWGSPDHLAQHGYVREIAYRPWGYEYVPRRYCEAKVRVSDGNETMVYYSIIEKGGFAGVGWGVEWCVVGYDYNLAYAPNCRAARP
jgi:hypothetical protein